MPSKKMTKQFTPKGKPAPPGQGQSKSARRRRALANRMQSMSQSNPMMSGFSPSKPYTNNQAISTAKDTGLRRLQQTPRRAGLTDQGIAFLKCAFAPPDFQTSSISGVPDDFRGPSLTRKHRFVSTVTFEANKDYYFLVAPVPGAAYFLTSVTANDNIVYDTKFVPTCYTDTTQMFPSPETNTSVVTRFRFISNHFEIIPTTNQMSWSGSISCWKLPLTVGDRPNTVANNLLSISGLEGCNSDNFSGYSGPFIQGIFAAAYSSDPVFSFKPVIDNVLNMPPAILTSDFGQLDYYPLSGPGFPGLDNGFESLIVKVSGITANQTCLVKTWACVEYGVNPGNVLNEFVSLSPCDRIAMELYREIILGLPVAVGFEDNDTFWQRVLGIISQITNVGALAPGPLGLASRGINMLSNAGLSLYR